MKGAASFFVALAATQGLASASPAIQASQPNDPKYVGYLGAFFLGDQPNVYFDLSNGNDPISFSPLNGGNPILKPTLGTGGVRDPSLVLGAGKELGKKYYIIGTDLNIGKTDWDTAQRHGSLSIFIWESTDLINWGNERLVKVENDSAGMVWAPDAIWDPDKGQYLVHWASKFYPASDPNHSGTMGPDMIRYAHTSDFVTFTEPATWIDESPWSIIDNNLLTIAEGKSYARFLKNESATNVYMERSDTGLFGTWYRPGGPGAYITSGVEGPASYWDNEIEGKAHLLLDYYGGDGYHPFETTDINANAWVPSDRTNFPTGRRHGSVIGVDKESYDSLKAATWS